MRLALVLVTLVLGACSAAPQQSSAPAASPGAVSSEDDGTAMPMSSEEATLAPDEQVTDYGRPAAAEDADRVVQVEATEEGGLRFEPEAVAVRSGETVTFRITNSGQLLHEFTMGDEATQAAHEAEMEAMGGASGGMAMQDELNAVAVEPGEAKELTWTFPTAGEVLYGCHEPGHYAGGMVGTITVS